MGLLRLRGSLLELEPLGLIPSSIISMSGMAFIRRLDETLGSPLEPRSGFPRVTSDESLETPVLVCFALFASFPHVTTGQSTPGAMPITSTAA